MKKRLKKLIKPSSYQSLNAIEIDANNIIHNLHTLQSLATRNSQLATIIPVLKSNAYGHGIKQICQILQKTPSDSCPLIAVDSYPEYQIAYDITDRDILILGEQLPCNYHLYDPRRTHFAVGSLANLQALIDTDRPRNIHLFLNTGMNREGFQEKDIDSLTQLLTSCPPYEGGRSEATEGSSAKGIQIVGIMSHFANADCIDSSYNQTQIDRFKDMHQKIIASLSSQERARVRYIHINNSAGITKNHDPLFTASRAGLAFYGYNPLESDDPHYSDYSDLRPALRLTSTITSLQHLQPGESVSYGHKWTASEPTAIAAIPFGYHEGLPRSLSNTGYPVIIKSPPDKGDVTKGQGVLIGTICMNISLILLAPFTEGGKSEGQGGLFDTIELISPDPSSPNSIESMSQLTQQIPYEILVGLDPKIKRIMQ